MAKRGDSWRPAATVKEQAAQIQKVSAQLVVEIAGVLVPVEWYSLKSSL